MSLDHVWSDLKFATSHKLSIAQFKLGLGKRPCFRPGFPGFGPVSGLRIWKSGFRAGFRVEKEKSAQIIMYTDSEFWKPGSEMLGWNIFVPVLHNVLWLGFGQIESRLIQTLSKKNKIEVGKVRSLGPQPRALARPVCRLTFIRTVIRCYVWMTKINLWLFILFSISDRLIFRTFKK